MNKDERTTEEERMTEEERAAKYAAMSMEQLRDELHGMDEEYGDLVSYMIACEVTGEYLPVDSDKMARWRELDEMRAEIVNQMASRMENGWWIDR